MKTTGFRATAILAAILAAILLAACGSGQDAGDGENAAAAEQEQGQGQGQESQRTAGRSEVVVPATLADLELGAPLLVADTAATNPTTAHDAATGTVFMAWTREAPGEAPAEGEDPRLEAVVARSDDGGKTFSDQVVVSDSARSVYTRTVSPTQVAVGPTGTVYVLYQYAVP
ncbi:MAG: sialidase family protein [Acidimicrobiia bacterium]